MGHFYPLSKEDQLCTLGDCAKVPEGIGGGGGGGGKGGKIAEEQYDS